MQTNLFDTPQEVQIPSKFQSKSPLNKQRLSGQNKALYDYLLLRQTITDLEAVKLLGIRRLASRIFELKEIFRLDTSRTDKIYDRYVHRQGITVKEYSMYPFLNFK